MPSLVLLRVQLYQIWLSHPQTGLSCPDLWVTRNVWPAVLRYCCKHYQLALGYGNPRLWGLDMPLVFPLLWVVLVATYTPRIVVW